jgi:hypothetical protein
MEDGMPRTSSRGIRYFTLHRERASFIVIREAPRVVGAEIEDDKFCAPGDGHDIVRMRALLTVGVGTGTVEVQHCAGRRVEEVWWRRGQRAGQERPRIVLLFSGASSAPMGSAKTKGDTRAQTGV